MATYPALVKAIAEVDGRAVKVIDNYGRVLREAGYIPTGRRGGGAEHMSSLAAANLVIGINASETAKDSPLALERVRRLEGWGDALGFGTDGLEFGPAITALIDHAEDILTETESAFSRLRPNVSAAAIDSLTKSSWAARDFTILKVEINRGGASISIQFPGGEKLVRYFSPPPESVFYNEGVDREVTASFGLRTILTAHRAIRTADAAD